MTRDEPKKRRFFPKKTKAGNDGRNAQTVRIRPPLSWSRLFPTRSHNPTSIYITRCLFQVPEFSTVSTFLPRRWEKKQDPPKQEIAWRRGSCQGFLAAPESCFSCSRESHGTSGKSPREQQPQPQQRSVGRKRMGVQAELGTLVLLGQEVPTELLEERCFINIKKFLQRTNPFHCHEHSEKSIIQFLATSTPWDLPCCAWVRPRPCCADRLFLTKGSRGITAAGGILGFNWRTTEHPRLERTQQGRV